MNAWPYAVLAIIAVLVVTDPETGFILVGFIAVLAVALVLLEKLIGKKPSR